MPADPARSAARKLIEIALRRQKPGSGSQLHILRSLPMQRWPDLSQVLQGVRWAIAGAVAARNYMPERSTRDLDVLVLASDLSRAEDLLVAAGYTREGNLTIGGSSWRAPDATPVDLIEGRGNWTEGALLAAASNLDADGSPVLTAPYLVLMKLLAARTIDTADVSRILGGLPNEDLAGVRTVVDAHAPELAEDLESLITLGKLESQQ